MEMMSDRTSNPNHWHETLTSGHEPDHANKRGLVIFVICFVAFAAVTYVALWFLLKLENGRVRDADRPRSLVAVVRYPLNAPPLQPTQTHDRRPQEDLVVMYRQEDRVFADMGWTVDQNTHEARLPDALVQRVASQANAHRVATASSRPATSPTTSRTKVITPVPAVDEGAPR
jgi:hypothetical protein